MLQVAAEPIQPPAHQHVEPAALGIWTSMSRAGRRSFAPDTPVIDVLDSRPAARLDVAPEFLQLVLRLLVERRRPARRWRGPHRVAAPRRSSRSSPAFEDLIGRLEDALRRALRDRIPGTPPALDVASAVLDAGQPQGRTTEQRDGFGFAFPQAARGALAVGLLAFGGVAEQHVGEFVEPRLVRHRVDRVDRDRRAGARSPGSCRRSRRRAPRSRRGQSVRERRPTSVSASAGSSCPSVCASTNQCGR